MLRTIMRTTYKGIWLFAAIVNAGVQAAEPFALKIERKHVGTDCTSGYLSVNGAVQMYALEKPWKNNQPLISSIPPGTYHGRLRYDHADRWRIELSDVPERSNVQIHIGNTTADSLGCILVGSDIDANSLCRLSGSKDAYAKLKKAFYGTDTPNSTPDRAIILTIAQ
jgi:hypothetical protein